MLERLARSDAHRPALVLTRPDRPSGRGRRLTSPPVAERARALGIPLEQPHERQRPAGQGADRAAAGAAGRPPAPPRPSTARQTVVVCAFGALIKEPLLSEHEILNVHPSLLPRWRGAAPIERAIMAGDERTGVSIMRLTAGLDSGPVCLAGDRADPRRMTPTARSPRACRSSAASCSCARSRSARRSSSRTRRASPTPRRSAPADRLLDPARPAVELERVVRALHPHIGARVRARRRDPARACTARRSRAAARRASRGARRRGGRPGRADGRLLLDCAPGVLELLVVQPPGGRAMDAAAYLRGHGPPGRR